MQAIASSPSLLLPVYINQEPIEQSFCGEGRQYGGGNSVSHIGNHFCMSIMTCQHRHLFDCRRGEASMADAELLKLDCVPQFISSITSSWHWHGKGIAIHPLKPGREWTAICNKSHFGCESKLLGTHSECSCCHIRELAYFVYSDSTLTLLSFRWQTNRQPRPPPFLYL